jgi:AraC family transcriptional regulator, arabinose operon regulatory protein
MPRRPITASFPNHAVYGDEFIRRKAYTNWRPHGSGDWLLIYTVEGAGLITTSKGSRRMGRGDVVLFEPGARQDYRTHPSAGSWRLLWAHFHPRPAWIPWLNWPEIDLKTRFFVLPPGEARQEFGRAMRRLVTLSRRRGSWMFELAYAALEEALLWTQVVQAEATQPLPDTRIQKAAAFLRDNFKQPFSLPNLAKTSALSVSRFSHLFRRQMGCTPVQFLEQQRLAHATQLLRLTGMSVEEVAAESGYDDPFYFSNRFRQHLGRSPRNFRIQSREGRLARAKNQTSPKRQKTLR